METKKVKHIQAEISETRGDYQKVQMYRHAATHFKLVKAFANLEELIIHDIAELEKELFG
jgi:hypothetical protein